MNDFNYYSFILNREERIFYTYVTLDNEEDILSWALRYNFIKESDMAKCSSVRLLSPEEIQKKTGLYSKNGGTIGKI